MAFPLPTCNTAHPHHHHLSSVSISSSHPPLFSSLLGHRHQAPSFPHLKPNTIPRRRLRLSVIAMAPPKSKKVVGIVKLALEAGRATPAPPVGPALGSKGVNIMAFCKDYNARTADKPGFIIPVEITVYDDKSFTFILKTPPASVLLRKAAGVEKGSAKPNSEKVGMVTADQVRTIAIEKLPDLNCTSIESAMRIIAGTAANMGIDVNPPILDSTKKKKKKKNIDFDDDDEEEDW
ncbi:hypothetical protein Droror1_Dr00005260 [Drosera rotundifolia]